jgi:UDP-GlcNAc:undecaprenyl-phosphate GlcNAc-1-phosphate transferase
LICAIVFASTLGLALLLTPLVRLLALRLGVVDHPERRKVHHLPIPLLGGASIVVSFLVVVGLTWAIEPELFGDDAAKVPLLLFGAAAIGALGAYDDWKGCPIVLKFLVQIVVAAVLVVSGIQARLFTNPLGSTFELGWLGVPVTIFWIVGVTNAMNLIDGLDGLAGGVGAIASLSLCGVAAAFDQPLVAIMSLALAGSTLGFLPYNLYPARIFLGDTGSMFLGFLLASFGVAGSLKATTATVLIIPIVVLGIPVIDTLWAIFRRTRMKLSPFAADRDHIHHRLVRVGLHHRHVVLVLYFICAFLGVSASVMTQIPYRMSFIFASFLALGGILGVWTLKYVDDQLEAKLVAAGERRQRASTPPPELTMSQWRATNGSRPSTLADFQVNVCEVGRFTDGFETAPAFGGMAEQIRDVLGRRLKVFAVGAYMQEDRSLLLVLKTSPLDGSGFEMVRDAVLHLFHEHAGEWGVESPGLTLRWVRSGGQNEGQALLASHA